MYQLIKVSQAVSASAGANEFLKETDTNFPWITGIMLYNWQGTGDTIRVGIETTSGLRIINPVPVALLNMDGVNRTFDDLFIPVNIPAAGDAIKAIYDFKTVTATFKCDVVLRLEKEPRFQHVKKFQLQHKQLTIKSGSTGWESDEIVVISGYKKLKGIWINTLTGQRVAVKSGGEYLLDPVPCKNLTAGIYGPYDKRFFPIDVPAPRILTVETDSLTAPGVDIIFDAVFILE